MKEAKNKRRTGAQYEQTAAEYLVKRGYRILEQNYRSRNGEIDIIAEKDSVLVFVEVKFRASLLHGHPLEAVDYRKQRKICQTALHYYARHGYGEGVPCRFDVIGICGDREICHVKNAFEFTEY